MQLTIFFYAVSILLPAVGQSYLFVAPAKSYRDNSHIVATSTSSRIFAGPKDNEENSEQWDADVDYDKEWPITGNDSSPLLDPTSAWDAIDNEDGQPKLGIDIGKGLAPLSEKDAEELKGEATAMINEKISSGIEDIDRLRSKMKRELEQGKKAMQFASELKAKEKSEQLMNKIDKMTGDFLQSTGSVRESTKLAAAASKSMVTRSGSTRGLEIGTWGVLDGRTVVAGEGINMNDSLLGSVDNAMKQSEKLDSTEVDERTRTENRIIIIADTKQDPMAKALLPSLVEKFRDTNIPNLNVDVLAPTTSMPLGGNDAACVICFCSSISEASSLRNMLDRLLRKTLSGTTIGQPPTQLIGISTLGTERTDKFPYSMQNLMGGKLDKRRQVEEALISTVRNRVVEPPLDYTIVKLGEVKDGENGKFQLRPGDVLDDAISIAAATTALVQAVAFQPLARNSTMSVSGALSEGEKQDSLFWDTSFLCLEGPELWRMNSVGNVEMFGQLVEYIQGWADILAENGKGLTTPVQIQNGVASASFSKKLLKQQDGVQLLFKQTATGKNYLSRSEEKSREKEGQSSRPLKAARIAREGGVDVVVEITQSDELLVRARRCNYGEDAIVKEISEQTILKQLAQAMDVWRKDHI